MFPMDYEQLDIEEVTELAEAEDRDPDTLIREYEEGDIVT